MEDLVRQGPRPGLVGDLLHRRSFLWAVPERDSTACEGDAFLLVVRSVGSGSHAASLWSSTSSSQTVSWSDVSAAPVPQTHRQNIDRWFA